MTFPELPHAKYLTLMGASSSYHNLTLNKKSSYLTTFCINLADTYTSHYCMEWLQQVICSETDRWKIQGELQNEFGIADESLVEGCNTSQADHDKNYVEYCRHPQRIIWSLIKINVI